MEGTGHRRQLKLRAFLVACLAVGCLAVNCAAFGDPPAPTPGNAFQQPNVKASIPPPTQPAQQPSVGYDAWQQGISGVSNPIGPRKAEGACSAITPDQAAIRFGSAGSQWILVGGSWYFAGWAAPGVIQVSAKPQADDEWKIASPYLVVCDGALTGFGWYIPRPASPASPTALPAVAAHVAGQIPLPGVSIQVAPKDRGLTGLSGWFWVGGMPAGGVFASTASALGATIDVEARPTSFVWDFGDGSQPVTTSSPGIAYPGIDGPGAIHHVYQVASGTGYALSLTFVLDVRYRTNGSPWTDLGTVRRTISVPYRVGELRSTIVARG